jgi:hypothetical protein
MTMNFAAAARTSALLLGLFTTIAATTACDDHSTAIHVGSTVLPSSPSPVVVLQIQPTLLAVQTLPFFGCPFFPPLTTDFRLFVPPPEVSLRLDSVTIHLIDGQGVGGTPVPFPHPDLVRLFGSPVVLAGVPRSFPFTVQFGCFPLAPTLLTADVTLVTTAGTPLVTTLSAAIQ